MAEIVNLRSARKARARAEAARQAERNRHAFGRSKADKLGAEGEKARLEAIVDGAKREPE
jgi:hypothetical protein